MRVGLEDIRLEQGPSGGRYVLPFADGSAAELVYVQGPSVVTITHTETPRQHRGGGVAAKLVAKAVEDFRASRQKVIPACWYARQQFEQHPEWTELLAHG